jgi:hypothetical protein
MIVNSKRNIPNTPYITNTAAEVFRKRKAEMPPPPPLEERTPNLKLEYFSEEKPAVPKRVDINASNPLYIFNGTPPGFDPAIKHLYQPTKAHSYGPNVNIPVQQVYNIKIPGPTGAHAEISSIIENIMPGREANFTMNTLGERMQLYDYIRQILVYQGDGEDISVDSTGHRNLMSYIKLLELNPHYSHPYKKNPYRGLPLGLIIYRSCFPIRYNERSNDTMCARDSTGLNIRLYALNIAENFSYIYRQPIFRSYDVWRELMFYEYVRECILKRKQSPNFPMLYCFFLCKNRNVDFFSLKRASLTQRDIMTKEYHAFKGLHMDEHGKMKKMWPDKEHNKELYYFPDEVYPELQKFCGTTLICVTESPNHNMVQWASRQYSSDGIVQKMISHGYHTDDVWFSIIFQLVSALYVMQLHDIYIRDMSMEDNVYVKDLKTSGPTNGYWKYVVQGVNFYVPNYGYLVMIDSNYKDIMPETRALTNKRINKINSRNIYPDEKHLTSVDFKELIFQNYRNIINTNNFTAEHTQNGMFRPSDKITDLISNMMKDDEKNLGVVMVKYFKPLMNNRIGTFLRSESELPYTRKMSVAAGKLRPGDMAVLKIDTSEYKWIVIDGISGQDVTYTTKTDPETSNFITKTTNIGNIRTYSPSEPIEQEPGKNIVFSKDQLLETYLLD